MKDHEFDLFENIGNPVDEIKRMVDNGELTTREALLAAMALLSAETTDVTMAYFSVLHALDHSELTTHIEAVDIKQGPGVMAVGFKVKPGWHPSRNTTPAQREAMTLALLGVLRAGGLEVSREKTHLTVHNRDGSETSVADPWSGAISEFRAQMDRTLGEDSPDPMDRWMPDQPPKEGGGP